MFAGGTIWFVARILILSFTAAPYDALINLDGVRALRDGHPLYAYASGGSVPLFNSFISTPFVAVLLYPLSGDNLLESVLIFRGISVFAYVLAVFILSKAAHLTPDDGTLAYGLFWLLAFGWEPMFDSIGLGQLNEWLLLCLAVAYGAQQRRYDGLQGASIGIAMAMKLIPGLVLAYWVLRGRRRPAIIALMTAGLILIVTGLVVPLNDCVAFVRDILPAISRGSSYHYNQTLNGVGMRLASDYAVWGETDIEPNRPLIRSAATIGTLGLLAVTAWTLRLWTTRQQRSRAAHGLEFGLVVVLMLLASPITWWHYYVWMIVALAAVCQPEVWRELRSRHLIWLAVALLLINVPPAILYKLTAPLAARWRLGANIVNSAGLVGTLLFWAFLLVIYRGAGVQRR